MNVAVINPGDIYWQKKQSWRRYSRIFKDYYLPEDKRICPRCMREDNHG